MCTFKDEQTVQVCDVAIGRVRERLQEVFGETVQYTTVNGQGTLVQAPSTVDAAQFQSVTPSKRCKTRCRSLILPKRKVGNRHECRATSARKPKKGRKRLMHTRDQGSEQNHSHEEHNHVEDVHHEHDGHAPPHDHEHVHGRFGWLIEALPFLHGHSHGEAKVDNAMETSDRGIWALKVSLVGLGVTALFQLVIALLSRSVGLLADTIHNFSDAFTAVPLWIAFALARRPANRRYTYGYGRAEDVAGVIIVLIIFASSLVAAYESYQKFFHPEPLRYVWWVMAAAIIGFVGNEGVAILRMRIGREIGSAALVADGQHARVDGLTSLAVLIGAVGSLLGFPLADPIIGVVITVAILFIVKDTAVTMWRRLMDAVDPEMVEAVEQTARTIPGTEDVHDVRLRWIGHKLQSELHITVNEDLSTYESHHLAEQVRHALFDAQPNLSAVTVHVDPCGHSGRDPHALLAHHQVS